MNASQALRRAIGQPLLATVAALVAHAIRLASDHAPLGTLWIPEHIVEVVVGVCAPRGNHVDVLGAAVGDGVVRRNNSVVGLRPHHLSRLVGVHAAVARMVAAPLQVLEGPAFDLDAVTCGIAGPEGAVEGEHRRVDRDLPVARHRDRVLERGRPASEVLEEHRLETVGRDAVAVPVRAQDARIHGDAILENDVCGVRGGAPQRVDVVAGVLHVDVLHPCVVNAAVQVDAVSL
mmetsp:Transcript_86080/g.251854  ORF Transcript_86080/g.251854 Transcript_86080/m.251854 type:complete len:233 (+) Transcript_86080:133-831(+)